MQWSTLLSIRFPKSLTSLSLTFLSLASTGTPLLAAPPRAADQVETCEILIVGGGLAGTAAAYEGLLEGRTVCLTEITDWVGGQISAQGTSALDERATQRSLLFYPRGYLELRRRIEQHYGRLNPGACWVSVSCFMPYDGDKLLMDMLKDAARKGRGQLKWFPNTVVKEVKTEARGTGSQITQVIAIHHKPAPGTPPVHADTLSQTIEDAYRYENSDRLHKTIIEFIPKPRKQESGKADWYIVEATETGELIGLTDIPYRLGIDPRSHLEPTSASETGDPYCTQGFTYTFAMQATAEPQNHVLPSFYEQYAPYYSYELERLANFELVFTYRQILSMKPDEPRPGNYRNWPIYPGDISMQNWTWGNDYRPGTSLDNLIYTRDQLRASGQLEPGGWMGGLRTETLRRGEENAIGFFYWLVAGTTDSQLGDGVKKLHPNHRFLKGFDAPMGTAHGLSKYPYMREGRRIIGRPSLTQPEGFMVWEIDITRNNLSNAWYQENLPGNTYENLWSRLGGLNTFAAVRRQHDFQGAANRGRSSIYPDSVGIGHYAIDFHPCMLESPPEKPGNIERPGERRGQGAAYPFQIPLRAMIPQKIDNMLVAGKSIATSHIAAAAYRVHSFEWSAGVAAGATAAFALDHDVLPFELVDEMPSKEWQLEKLQQQLINSGNPIAFPGTSIFNDDWESWR